MSDDAKKIGDVIGDEWRPFANCFLDLTPEEQEARDAAISEARAREIEAEKRRLYQVKIQRLGSKGGFPWRAISAAETADEDMPAIMRVSAWNPDERSVLVLSGKPGCGKTVAAAWWAMRFNGTPTFLRASTFAASSRYDKDARALWMNAHSLVLDDLGTEYVDARGSFLTDLDELIDTLYGNRCPLIITTNLKAEDFRERYGARVVDRIRESGKWESIAGDSLRKAR